MTEQEYQLSPFVTPSLTDAVERTLLELQEQGVNLDELKDQPKIPINKKRNQSSFGFFMEVNFLNKITIK